MADSLSKSLKRVVFSAHSRKQTGFVVVTTGSVFIRVNNFFHPFQCFLVATHGLECILATTAALRNSVQLDYHLEISIRLFELAHI